MAVSTQKSSGGLAKVTAAAQDRTDSKGTIMHKPTFTTGQRVVVTGEPHRGIPGRVTAATDTDFLPYSVQLDNGRRAAYSADELEPEDDPIESHDTANGALWPRTIVEICIFADALGIKAPEVIGALESVYHSRQPDYAALEASALGEAFNNEPAGGDL